MAGRGVTLFASVSHVEDFELHFEMWVGASRILDTYILVPIRQEQARNISL
jgi:hypothetical protein